jgi:hypothetical protein
MPLVQCRKCHTDILVLGFAAHGPKRCPICGARPIGADAMPDLFRMSKAAIDAKRAISRAPRFRRSGPRVAG